MKTLSEELLLLAVHDEKGSVIVSAGSSLPYGIAAAILFDLEELGKIKLRANHVQLLDYTPSGFDFLDLPLIAIKNIKEPKEIKFWIKTFGLKNKDYIEIIFDKLVKDEVLMRVKEKVFWIKYESYPTLDPEPELLTRAQIHNSLLLGVNAGEKLQNLIALMFYCNLTSEVFPKGKRREAKSSISEMIKYNSLSMILRDVVKQMTSSTKILK
jgi:golgi phosphoprotein 3